MESLVPLATGLLFGFALDRGHVSLPFTIISQMSFQNFTMMRMFLGACVTSTTCVLAADVLGISKQKVKPDIGLTNVGFGGNILGGLLLGAGMALSGACPGTVWPQVTAFHSSQQFTVVAGGIFGVIAFGYLRKFITDRTSNFQIPSPDPMSKYPGALKFISTAMIICMIGAIQFFDHFFPWQAQLNAIPVSGSAGKVASGEGTTWDPLHAGIVVGLLQIPSILSLDTYFGQSSGWVYIANMVASVFDSNVDKHAPYLSNARTSKKPYWQFMSAIGAMMGGAISQQMRPASGVVVGAYDISLARAFFGGFILLFGARLGCGCTSGHGLSGVASGSIGSMISVACMFIGGGIASVIANPSLVF